MPSIPACCVKVDPAQDLSHVGHLKHTARELGLLRLMHQVVFEWHRGCQVPQRLLWPYSCLKSWNLFCRITVQKPIRILGSWGNCQAISVKFMSNVAVSFLDCGRFCQPSARMFLSVTSPQIPPCARSLCNYRCKLGVRGRLPGFTPPLPVNNTLPTTFHCVSCFCDLMPVSHGVKRVNVLMKVPVLLKLFGVKYIINP